LPIDLAKNAIPEPSSAPSALLDGKSNREFNLHNRDSKAGQIKEAMRGQIREDPHKEFGQKYMHKSLAGSDVMMFPD
jgi:hypothetical protein